MRELCVCEGACASRPESATRAIQVSNLPRDGCTIAGRDGTDRRKDFCFRRAQPGPDAECNVWHHFVPEAENTITCIRAPANPNPIFRCSSCASSYQRRELPTPLFVCISSYLSSCASRPSPRRTHLAENRLFDDSRAR